MKGWTITLVAGISITACAWAQQATTASPQPGTPATAQAPSASSAPNATAATTAAPAASNSQAGSGVVIPVQLTKSLDAKKLKQGDPVEARTAVELKTGGGAAIPRGSIVKGHITSAEARSKGGQQSSLGIVFDNITTKDGQQLPLKATIQAVGAPPQAAENVGSPQPGMSSTNSSGPVAGGGSTAGNGRMGGAPSGGSYPSAPSSPSTSQDNTAAGAPASTSSTAASLTPASTGVVGLQNLQLGADSTLTSTGKDVKLDAGTEMILRVQNQ